MELNSPSTATESSRANVTEPFPTSSQMTSQPTNDLNASTSSNSHLNKPTNDKPSNSAQSSSSSTNYLNTAISNVFSSNCEHNSFRSDPEPLSSLHSNSASHSAEPGSSLTNSTNSPIQRNLTTDDTIEPFDEVILAANETFGRRQAQSTSHPTKQKPIEQQMARNPKTIGTRRPRSNSFSSFSTPAQFQSNFDLMVTNPNSPSSHETHDSNEPLAKIPQATTANDDKYELQSNSIANLLPFNLNSQPNKPSTSFANTSETIPEPFERETRSVTDPLHAESDPSVPDHPQTDSTVLHNELSPVKTISSHSKLWQSTNLDDYPPITFATRTESLLKLSLLHNCTVNLMNQPTRSLLKAFQIFSHRDTAASSTPQPDANYLLNKFCSPKGPPLLVFIILHLIPIFRHIFSLFSIHTLFTTHIYSFPYQPRVLHTLIGSNVHNRRSIFHPHTKFEHSRLIFSPPKARNSRQTDHPRRTRPERQRTSNFFSTEEEEMWRPPS